jgi:hypothetical protein
MLAPTTQQLARQKITKDVIRAERTRWKMSGTLPSQLVNHPKLLCAGPEITGKPLCLRKVSIVHQFNLLP